MYIFMYKYIYVHISYFMLYVISYYIILYFIYIILYFIYIYNIYEQETNVCMCYTMIKTKNTKFV